MIGCGVKDGEVYVLYVWMCTSAHGVGCWGVKLGMLEVNNATFKVGLSVSQSYCWIVGMILPHIIWLFPQLL